MTVTQKVTMPTLLTANTHNTTQQMNGMQCALLALSVLPPTKVLSFMPHQYPLN